MRQPAHIAVLVSGGGSNLQALIDRFNRASHPAARVELVVASRAGIGALERAARAGIPSVVQGGAAAEADPSGEILAAEFDRHAIDLIVLAGYLRLIPAPVVRRYAGRMLNIHPALLPAFGGPGMYGIRVHRAVIEAGVRVSGATVHRVDERYDTGAILAQWPVPVLPDDTPETLAARVLAIEHRLLPAVVDAVARGEEETSTPVDPLSFALADDPAPAEACLQALIALPR